MLRCPEAARAPCQPRLRPRGRREPSFQAASGCLRSRHKPRAPPALRSAPAPQAWRLCAVGQGSPSEEVTPLPSRAGDRRRESSAMDPQQAAWPGTHEAGQSAPRPRAHCHHLTSCGTNGCFAPQRATRPQSLLRGGSRGRCSRHTTLTGSAAWSSSRKPPRSPVSPYCCRAGWSSVMGMLKFRCG